MREVEFTRDEAAVANRIKAIDAELDALDQRTAAVVRMGMQPSSLGFNWSHARSTEDSLDQKSAALLAERADLAQKLKTEVSDN